VSTASKRRGTDTENKVVKHLQAYWPAVERRVQHGALDQGDIINVPRFCVEVKGDRSNRLVAWRKETMAELVNSGADFCALVVRVERKAVDQWDLWMPLAQLGIPLYGEDAWVRMSVEVGCRAMLLLIDSPAGLSFRS
jgi:hypothetical protein